MDPVGDDGAVEAGGSWWKMVRLWMTEGDGLTKDPGRRGEAVDAGGR